MVGWLVWFKRYILFGSRSGALTLLKGLVYGGRSTYSEARPLPRDLNPVPRRGNQVSGQIFVRTNFRQLQFFEKLYNWVMSRLG